MLASDSEVSLFHEIFECLEKLYLLDYFYVQCTHFNGNVFFFFWNNLNRYADASGAGNDVYEFVSAILHLHINA